MGSCSISESSGQLGCSLKSPPGKRATFYQVWRWGGGRGPCQGRRSRLSVSSSALVGWW